MNGSTMNVFVYKPPRVGRTVDMQFTRDTLQVLKNIGVVQQCECGAWILCSQDMCEACVEREQYDAAYEEYDFYGVGYEEKERAKAQAV